MVRKWIVAGLKKDIDGWQQCLAMNSSANFGFILKSNIQAKTDNTKP